MLEAVPTGGAIATTCSATPIRYGANSDAPRNDASPWIAAGPGARRIVGRLFGYPGMLGDARVRTAPGLVLYAGRPAKIGWVPRHDWGALLTIEGRRLDGSGAFMSRHQRALSPRFYPSVVTVTSPGCWRMTLQTGGRRWTVFAEAIEPPAAPRCDLTPYDNNGIVASPPSSGLIAGWGPWTTPDGGALMYTGGKTPNGGNTKVLWRARRGHGSILSLIGTQLDAPGSFRQEFPMTSSEEGFFPSTVLVPQTGCWLLMARTGRTGGVIVFRAVTP
jgi:hypothetical protein